MSNIKQIIVIRKYYPNIGNGFDGSFFKLPRGKELVQVAHASMWFLRAKLKIELGGVSDDYTRGHIVLNRVESKWMQESFPKICLQVDYEQDLLDIYEKAKKANLEVNLVKDLGLTIFKEPTYTCLGIGPDYSEKIDPITKDLKLY